MRLAKALVIAKDYCYLHLYDGLQAVGSMYLVMKSFCLGPKI